MTTLFGILLGFAAWFVVRYVLGGFYTVEQNERAVKTVFGRAERIVDRTTMDDPALRDSLNEDERGRYAYPMVQVIPPGGPYLKMPWERVYKVSVATQTVSIGFDPDTPTANQGGQVLEAVTKDQLNTGLSGQLRFTISEKNLYAYLFGIINPYSHIMGFLHSVLRERIANFEAPSTDDNIGVVGISINDLRKNLRDINEHMEVECVSTAARYGVVLNAALITGIDPPEEVESALAAINTAHNHVSSDISLAQAAADQKIVQSRKAVEIETLRAQAETEPLRTLAAQLADLKRQGPAALQAYMRNVRLGLFARARRILLEVPHV